MPSETLVHDKTTTCQLCRLWIVHTYYDLDRAGQRGLDEKKIMDEVQRHRIHGVLSRAHFHKQGVPCNERCVA